MICGGGGVEEKGEKGGKAVSSKWSYRKAWEGRREGRRKTIKSSKMKWKGRGGTGPGQKGKRGR